MRVLILDDNPSRHRAYARRYIGHTVIHTYSFLQFKAELLSPPKVSQDDVLPLWDIVHLDHDLGEFEKPDSYRNGWGKEQQYTGMHAVDHILSLNEHNRPLKVIVHSVNGPAAQMMFKQLRGMGVDVLREPFVDPSWVKSEIDEV